MYFPSKEAMTLHRRALHPRRDALEPMAMEDESEQSDEDEVPAAAAEYEEDEPAPVFDNIFEIMAQNPFVEVGTE